MVPLRLWESAAAECRLLDEGDVYRRRGRDPVVNRLLLHARIGAIPEIIIATDDLRKPIHAGAVLYFVVLAVGSARKRRQMGCGSRRHKRNPAN